MERDKPLTAAEISQIWGSFMEIRTSIIVLKYFQQHVEDTDIKGIIRSGLELFKEHEKQIITFFRQEKHPIPHGFTEEDVNINAPKLFTDTLMLMYCLQTGVLGMYVSTISLSSSSRKDIYHYYSNAIQDYNTFHKKCLITSIDKGVYVETPTIPVSREVDYVKKQNFLNGWLGDKRPLLAIEITNLFSNLLRNKIGAAILTGYSQVVQTKEIRDFLLRGIEIAKKHVTIFEDALKADQVPVPSGSDALVTDSSDISPFSEKFMMFHALSMISIGIGFYGQSNSMNLRRDLASHYVRLSGEIGLYSEDGANLMIKNGWLEEPPRMVNRKKLMNQ